MNRTFKNVTDSVKKVHLYARVGLKGMTPLKAYRMLRYWILTTLFKKETPWLIELSVTYRCQCKCPHCSVGEYLDKASRKDELTSNQIKDVLAQAIRIGIPKVDFFGGEPLIKEDIFDLIMFGARKGLYMSVTTNAWMLTRDFVRQLKKARISCINISLDSASEKMHDRLRGLPGLYKRVIDATGFCHEEGIPCVLSTYVTRNRIKGFVGNKTNNSELAEIISFSKKLKASALRILFPIISGRWEGEKQKEFSEEEKRLVIENIDPSFAFIEGAYSVKNKKKVCQSLSGKMFNISPYGDIQLCVAFPETFGNIREAPLGDLLKRMYSHPIYLKNKNGNCCSSDGLIK